MKYYRLLCVVTAAVTVVAAVLAALLIAGIRTPVTSEVLGASFLLVLVWSVARSQRNRQGSQNA